MSTVDRFLKINARACSALERVWPYPLATTFWSGYAARAAELASSAIPNKVLDIGAGKETPYAEFLPASANVQLIGVDVLPEDMAENPALHARLTADIVHDGLPPESMGAGLITSRMVLEHLPNQDKSATEFFQALAPGGRVIHLFAARFSLFATINRLLPPAIAKRILFRLRPDSVEVGGFHTYYDRTNAQSIEGVYRNAGFATVTTVVSYQVSQYFTFFFPAFVIARCWETVLHRLRLKNLGAFVVLEARKPN